jgi:hypothetical protein
VHATSGLEGAVLHICCKDDGDEHVLGERVGEVIFISAAKSTETSTSGSNTG